MLSRVCLRHWARHDYARPLFLPDRQRLQRIHHYRWPTEAIEGLSLRSDPSQSQHTTGKYSSERRDRRNERHRHLFPRSSWDEAAFTTVSETTPHSRTAAISKAMSFSICERRISSGSVTFSEYLLSTRTSSLVDSPSSRKPDTVLERRSVCAFGESASSYCLCHCR